MNREFFLATALSAIWVCLCFVLFGGLYSTAPQFVGWERFSRFENALGQLDVLGTTTIPWVSLIVFGLVMVLATAPVNYYWNRRLTRAGNQR